MNPAKPSVHGAQEKTRTSTTLRSLAPEASVSTNFTTWAQEILGCPERLPELVQILPFFEKKNTLFFKK